MLANSEAFSGIGVDDLDLDSVATPPLTTIRLPRREMAKAAFDLLIEANANPEMPKTDITLPTELIVRASSAPVEWAGLKRSKRAK